VAQGSWKVHEDRRPSVAHSHDLRPSLAADRDPDQRAVWCPDDLTGVFADWNQAVLGEIVDRHAVESATNGERELSPGPNPLVSVLANTRLIASPDF